MDPQTFADVITMSNHVIDGDYLPGDPISLYAAGEFNPVELLLGFNSSEGLSFVLPMTAGEGVKSVDQAIKFITRMVTQMFYRGLPNTDKVIDVIVETYIKSLKSIKACTDSSHGGY